MPHAYSPHHSSHPRPRHLVAPIAAAIAAGAALILATPLVASAHVRVHPDDTSAGAYSELVFRVPTESDTASTTRLSIALPTATPLESVETRPVPGWSVAITTRPLAHPVVVEGTTLTKAPASITWTAGRGAAIPPGNYQEFSVLAGPLPAAGTALQLPATQTYSDGTVVRWNEPTPASGPEPEHPAPAFTVTAATPAGGTPGSTTTSAEVGSAVSDGTSRALAGVGLGVAVVALGVATVALRRRGGAAA